MALVDQEEKHLQAALANLEGLVDQVDQTALEVPEGPADLVVHMVH